MRRESNDARTYRLHWRKHRAADLLVWVFRFYGLDGMEMNSELENLKQLAQEMLARIAQLEAAEKEADWPKKGDVYWVVRPAGNVYAHAWANDRIDKGCLAIGNIFRTQQEAEKEAEARRVIAELRRCEGARKFILGELNYRVEVCALAEKAKNIPYSMKTLFGFGQAYFATEEHARAAIKTVGEDRIVAAAKWLAMGE